MKKIFLILAVFLSSAGASLAGTNSLTALLQRGLFEEEANHNLDAAMQAYQSAIAEHDKDRKLIATAIYRLGECYRKQGKANEAAAQYDRVVREYSDQEQLVKLSRANLGGSETAKSAPGSGNPAYRSLDSVYQEVTAKEISARALLNRVNSLTNRQDKVKFFSVVRPDEPLVLLQREQAKAELELTKASQDFGNDHPSVKTALRAYELVSEQIAKRVDTLVWAIQNEYDSAAAQKSELQKELSKLNTTDSKPAESLSAATRRTTAEMTTASEDEEIRRIKTMIQNSPDLINARNSGDSGSPLHKAAKNGHLVVAEFLLSNGAEVNLQDDTGATPLYCASLNGHKAMVELLLAKGADLERANKSGQTSLHIAIIKGFKGVVEVLITHKANVDARDKQMRTPLHKAAEFGSPALMELLLSYQADIAARDQEGQTALHVAAKQGRSELIQSLITRKADVNATDVSKMTPIYFALLSGNAQSVKLLLENGADTEAACHWRRNMGARPLSWAISMNRLDLVDLLLSAHANPNSKFDYENNDSGYGAVKTWLGTTPLLMAVHLSVNTNILESLLSNGADANLMSDEGIIPLALAIGKNNVGAVQLLIKHKVSLEARMEDRPFLVTAADANQIEIVEALLKAGVDVNAVEKGGYHRAALHYAVIRLNKPMVELLIAQKANVNAVDDFWSPPFAYAKPDPNFPERKPLCAAIAEVLRKAGANANYERLLKITFGPMGGKDAPALFYRGTNNINRHTLAELITAAYSFQIVRTPYGPSYAGNLENTHAVSFPDFTKMRINRLQPDGESKIIEVNFEPVLNAADPSKDLWLEWGDIVEIGQVDHKVTDSWTRLSDGAIQSLVKLTIRRIEMIVKGQSTNVTLLPNLPMKVSDQNQVKGIPLPYFFLDPVLRNANVLLASSDLSRVKVRRADPETKEAREMLFNLEQPQNPDLWLRDGDFIEILERAPGFAPPSVNNRLPRPGPGRPIPLPAPQR